MKTKQFNEGDIVKHTDGDGRPYEVISTRYLVYPNGEDWEYTIKDKNTGRICKNLGGLFLAPYKDAVTISVEESPVPEPTNPVIRQRRKRKH